MKFFKTASQLAILSAVLFTAPAAHAFLFFPCSEMTEIKRMAIINDCISSGDYTENYCTVVYGDMSCGETRRLYNEMVE